MLFWSHNVRKVIRTFGLEGFVRLDGERLVFMTLCYFSDIVRLKKFHPVKRTNQVKFFAYSFYWMLRIMPIQIANALPKEKENLASINDVVTIGMWGSEFLVPLRLNDLLKFRYMSELQYFIKYGSSCVNY